jgi:hypothetical protein
MRNLLSLSTSLRERLALAALCPAVLVVSWLAAAGLHNHAVANRLIDKLGVSDLDGGGIRFGLSSLVDTVLKPAGGAGKVEISALITAIVGLVLLGAIVFFLFGILKTVGGRRGGLEAVGTVVFALVVGIAGLEVLA